jgi:hypothetical protein
MKRSALAALTAIGLVFAMGLVAPELRAQTFPSEPITLIVAWPAGGGSDISMRLLADGLAAAGDILAFAGWSPDHACPACSMAPSTAARPPRSWSRSRVRPRRSSPCLTGMPWRSVAAPGPALAIAAIGSLFAGSVVTLLIAVAGPPLASIALLFQSADYVAVMLLGLVSAVVLAHGSVLKAVGMIVLGVLFGLVGTDVSTGEYRLTMGIDVLFDGIGFVPLSIGLFGLAEIMVRRDAREAGDGAVANACSSQAILCRYGAWNGRGCGIRDPAGRAVPADP